MVEVLLLPIRVNPYAAMHATERWQVGFVPACKVVVVEVRAPLASHLAHFFCLVLRPLVSFVEVEGHDDTLYGVHLA